MIEIKEKKRKKPAKNPGIRRFGRERLMQLSCSSAYREAVTDLTAYPSVKTELVNP